MKVRTSQGTIAWVLSLVAFPYIAVPAYWVFGRNRFHGYRETLESAFRKSENARQVTQYRDCLRPFRAEIERDFHGVCLG